MAERGKSEQALEEETPHALTPRAVSTPHAPDTRPTGPPQHPTHADGLTPAAPLQSEDVSLSSLHASDDAGPDELLFTSDTVDTAPEIQRKAAPAPDPLTTTLRSEGRASAAPEIRASQAGGFTQRSLERPAPPSGSTWDERRVMRLEREIDQLTASQKLLEKRLAEASVTARIGLGLAILAVALAAILQAL